jgi:lipopolysaccharide export system permease LptF/LptG-like protein
MKHPGEWLRAQARRVCSPKTMERLIDPVVADLQTEYRAADASGRRWKARGILIAGYAGFAKAMLLRGWQSMSESAEWTTDDRRALGRTSAIAAGAVAMAIVLFEIPPLQYVSTIDPQALLFLIPQTLPLAIPVGVTLGVLFGLRGGFVGRRLSVVVVLVALACSAFSLGALDRLVPVSNQAFRGVVFKSRPLGRGLNELTLGELRVQMRGERVPNLMAPLDPQAAAVAYHARLSLSCASFAFAIFALAVVRNRSVKRWLRIAAAAGAFAGYYAIMFGGVGMGRHALFPPAVGAWLANIALLLVAAIVATLPAGKISRYGEPTIS